MRKTKNIWTVKCEKTKKDFTVTKHTDNIIYDVKDNLVTIIAEVNDFHEIEDKQYDLILNKKYYKIVDTVDIHDLMNLTKLFEGRCIKYKKLKGE